MSQTDDQAEQLSPDQHDGLRRCGVPEKHIEWAAQNFRYSEGERLLCEVDTHRRTILIMVLSLAALPPIIRLFRMLVLGDVQLYNQFLYIDIIYLIFLGFFLFPFERAWDFRNATRLNIADRVQLAIRLLAGPYHEPTFDKGGRIFTPWISKLLFLFEKKNTNSQLFFEERIEERAKNWRNIAIAFLLVLLMATFGISNRGGWVTEDHVIARPTQWPFQADHVIAIDEIRHVRIRCERSNSSNGGVRTMEQNRAYYEVEFQNGFFLNLASMRAPSWNRTDILYELDQRLRQNGTRFSRGYTSQRCMDRRAIGRWADILHTTPEGPARRNGK